MLTASNIKAKIFENLKEQLFYSNKCLDGEKATADMFFNEISYQVDLTKMYKVKDTCVTNTSANYCPVILEIINQEVIKAWNGNKYLLQVWNKQGQKMYERSLKSPTSKWQICGDYFVFIPNEGDKGSEFVHLVSLTKEGKTLLIKDIAVSPDVRYLYYFSNILYSANSQVITYVSIPSTLFDGENLEVDCSALKIRRIDTELAIHGCYERYSMMMFMFERHDGQFDFSSLQASNIDDDETQTYKFIQYAEPLPRPSVQNDPIVKSCLFQVGSSYIMSLRKSGKFDLYWAQRRVNSPEDKFAVDIAMSKSHLYFKMVDNTVWSFPHKDKTDLDFSAAEQVTDPNALEIFDKVPTEIVQGYLNIYSDFKIVKIDEKTSFLILAHGNFLSIYDIAQEQWIKHTQYEEDDIKKFFSIKDKDGKVVTGVVLNNGSVYIDDLKYTDIDQLLILNDQANMKVSEKIVRIYEDASNSEILFILCQKDNEYLLKCIYRDVLHDLAGLTDKVDNNFNVIRLSESKSFFLIQNCSKVYKYSVTVENEKPILKQEALYKEYSSLGSMIEHAAFGNNEDTLLLFKGSNAYLHYKGEKELQWSSYSLQQSVIGIKKFSPEIIYAVCTSVEGYGLRLFDINSIIKNQKVTSTLLKSILPGFNGNLQYCPQNRRLGLQESFTRILVFPELHLNFIKFMGIQQQCLSYKVINDKYIALGKDHILYTWSLVTGKLLSQHKLSDQYNYTDYDINTGSEVYRSNGRTLLVSKQEIPDTNIEDQLEPFQSEKLIDKQVTYSQNNSKSVKRWILLEIINEKEIKELVNLVFPRFTSNSQYVYFNQNADMMIEWHYSHNNIYLYQLNTTRDKISTTSTYKYIKKFVVWPEGFNGGVEFLPIISPDFSQMLDPQIQEGYVSIRDTITNQELYKIPKNLMDLKAATSESHLTNKFKWIDSHTFKVINDDGIERMIDYTGGNFKEVSSNVAPFFDKTTDRTYRYYIAKRERNLSVDQTYEQLRKCYIEYKSLYQLDNERDKSKLYSNLLTVQKAQINFAQHSFTYMHWSIIEQIQKEQITIDTLEDSVLQNILFNIFPGGYTFLHRLCQSSQDEQILKLFKRSQPNKEDPREIKMYVPLIANFNQKTALHLCADKNNFKAIETILQHIQYYEIDHHSKVIKDLIPLFISQDIPAILDYLDNRLIQNQAIKQIQRGQIKQSNRGIVENSLWINKETLQNRLFEKSEIEPSIKCEFVDLPGIYHIDDKDFDSFYDALASSSNYDIFKKKAIQKMIDFNFRVVRSATIYKLFFPFTLFLLTFVLYLNLVYEFRFSKDLDERTFWFPIDLAMMIILGLFSVYFFANEVKQFRKDGLGYLTSIWNFIDIIPPIGIFIMLTLSSISQTGMVNNTFERVVQAIATFFMWFKLLYFLRIFKNTGYLIRMIIEVVYDMRSFLLVLLITIAAFGDSMMSLSAGNQEAKQFIPNFITSLTYTYRLVLGDWETDNFGEVAVPLVWILFLLCTIINMIVMLNLLIAIISETFAKVNENALSAGYQENAALISENSYLVPDYIKQNYAMKDRYLLIVTDLENEVREFKDPVLDKISDMFNEFKTFKASQDNQDKKLVEQQEKLAETQKKIIEEHENHKNAIQKELEANKETLQKVLSLLESHFNKEEKKEEVKEEDVQKEEIIIEEQKVEEIKHEAAPIQEENQIQRSVNLKIIQAEPLEQIIQVEDEIKVEQEQAEETTEPVLNQQEYENQLLHQENTQEEATEQANEEANEEEQKLEEE